MYTMKTRYFYGIITAILIMFGSVSCSDNLDKDLEPVKTVRTLEVIVDGAKTHVLDFKANPDERIVKVTSNTRWTVVVENCDGGWCGVDVINGKGDGSFTISVLDNLREKRDCDVIVYKVNSQGEKDFTDSWLIKITQEVSDVRLTPSKLEAFEPQSARFQEFNIVSNVAWTLDVTYDDKDPVKFVEIVPTSGMTETEGGYMGDGNATFQIKLDDNRTSVERKAYINLRSEVSTYTVEIVQNASEYTFDVSPSENQVISARGDSINFGILSLVGWDIETSIDWISFSKKSSDTGSSSRVETMATIEPNTDGDQRNGVIRFIPKDSRYPELSVTVTQLGFNFDVTPIENQVIAAEGGSISFGVLSIVGWDVKSNADWVSFSVPSYDDSSTVDRVETIAVVSPNYDGYERSAEIVFVPKSPKYPEVNVSLVQRGYDLTFHLTSNGGSGMVMETGGSLDIELDSRFNWHVETPGWISASPGMGGASDSSNNIGLTVDANYSNNNRTAFVTVYPEITPFPGGIMLDPKDLGIEPVKFGVTQFGGQEPAVSVPWVLDGFGQEFATVQFNYYSPFYPIESAGLQWRRAEDTEWIDTPYVITETKEGVVSFDLTGLVAATEYVARGYVVYSDGKKKYGSATYPFITAGVRPGQYDNPIPGINR